MEKIKLIMIFILGIMISVVISTFTYIKIRPDKKVSYIESKQLKSTSDPDYISGKYSSTNTINSHVTALESYSALTGISRNTTNTSDGNIYGYKVGKVVYISGWVKVKSGAATKSVIATGLPVAKTNINVFCYDQDSGTMFSFYIAVNTSNMTLEYAIGTHAGHILNITAIYSFE